MNTIYCPGCLAPLDSRKTIASPCPAASRKLSHYEVMVHDLWLITMLFHKHRSERKTPPPTSGRGAGANGPLAPAIHPNGPVADPIPSQPPGEPAAT